MEECKWEVATGRVLGRGRLQCVMCAVQASTEASGR